MSEDEFTDGGFTGEEKVVEDGDDFNGSTGYLILRSDEKASFEKGGDLITRVWLSD